MQNSKACIFIHIKYMHPTVNLLHLPMKWNYCSNYTSIKQPLNLINVNSARSRSVCLHSPILPCSQNLIRPCRGERSRNPLALAIQTRSLRSHFLSPLWPALSFRQRGRGHYAFEGRFGKRGTHPPRRKETSALKDINHKLSAPGALSAGEAKLKRAIHRLF